MSVYQTIPLNDLPTPSRRFKCMNKLNKSHFYIHRAFACDSINTVCKASNKTVDDNINSKSTTASPDRKKLKFHLRKPLLKSIILSATSPTQPEIVIKKEPDTCTDSLASTSVCEPLLSNRWQPISAVDQADANEGTPLANMNKPNRGNHVPMVGMRSYSTPMARVSKSKSTVAGNSPRNKSDKRSRESKDRRSSKKRKHRRRSHSRSSNSR